ncbi:MAG TPA: PIG-L family deacetylase [Verrucomicrobiae bacterium]|nr:PIG-L family deacetylase [Verrucomicrobiae bacterium]
MPFPFACDYIRAVKIMSIHAHFDDFEFVASGTFELWRRKLGSALKARVLVCTDGKAGHHFRTREETMHIRIREQEQSAVIGGYEFRSLCYPNGEIPREACLQMSTPLLAALWKEIRDFRPDYIFAPPVPADPLAGIHVDHVTVAEAVRKVAYMINVPHAFTPEYPADETKSEPCPVPVILTVHDGYMSGANIFDLAVDVHDAFEKMCAMSWCHQSQIAEWLPWVGRHDLKVPGSITEWRGELEKRFRRRNRELGLPVDRIREFFTVTAWGNVPTADQVLNDFPDVDRAFSQLDALRARLARWRGAE